MPSVIIIFYVFFESNFKTLRSLSVAQRGYSFSVYRRPPQIVHTRIEKYQLRLFCSSDLQH